MLCVCAGGWYGRTVRRSLGLNQAKYRKIDERDVTQNWELAFSLTGKASLRAHTCLEIGSDSPCGAPSTRPRNRTPFLDR